MNDTARMLVAIDRPAGDARARAGAATDRLVERPLRVAEDVRGDPVRRAAFVDRALA